MIFRELNELLTFVERIVKYLKCVIHRPVEQAEPQESIASRFVRLFEKHGVHRNQIPRFFGHGLTLADVADEEKLLIKLTPEIL